MIKIGLTGQSGFIGNHLFNFLGLQENVERVTFKHIFFEDTNLLREFVKNCDVIVHLAAMNRHSDPQIIYQTNTNLVRLLIQAMEAEKVNPHIIFSSSTQEGLNNLYGLSKKDGRNQFVKWAKNNSAIFSGLIIPNVFGPFGKPFYNSVIGTFSYQLTHSESPVIQTDNELELIYVDELVKAIWQIILQKSNCTEIFIKSTATYKVSQLLSMLNKYKELYFNQNIIPSMNNRFEINLFNTFRSYIDNKDRFPALLQINADQRGSFIETIKTLTGGQFSYSTTFSGITRGEHFHTRKIERFIVIKGKAAIELRRIGTNEILRFELDGEKPSFVDMPVWYTHNITNVGSQELLTLFWINEFFDKNDPDTFFENVRK